MTDQSEKLDALDQVKADLRKQQTKRRAEAARQADDAAKDLAASVQALIKAFDLGADDIVAGYWPIKTELDPRPLMAALASQGIATALPATPKSGQPLIFHHWVEGDVMIDGLYGTLEPSPEAPVCYPTLVLVPMLAFDDRGYRLGYGGGFYDRSLAGLRERGGVVRAVGLAYNAQRVEVVPIGPYDARLDAVLTETRLLQI